MVVHLSGAFETNAFTGSGRARQNSETSAETMGVSLQVIPLSFAKDTADPLTQEQIALALSHLNSYPR